MLCSTSQFVRPGGLRERRAPLFLGITLGLKASSREIEDFTVCVCVMRLSITNKLYQRESSSM